ncbi:MAG: class I SAM-dependent methyltransferase [Candidatus Pacearchaeota archaeon]|nr:class I SAM-dependent methyltransferase [Candidatus Pacearchaeota archaeon]
MDKTKELKATWDKHASKRNYKAPALEELKKSDDFIIRFLLKTKAKGLLLDAGCGSGGYITAARLIGFKSVGLDISEQAVNIARKRKEKVILGDMRKMSFKNNTFDIVTAGGSIEHFPETHQAIREISRVLKNQGILIVNVPYKYALLYSLSRKIQQMLGIWKAGYEKAFSKAEFSKLLKKNNFEILKIEVTPIAQGKHKIISNFLRLFDMPFYFLGLGGGHVYFIARKK